MRRVTNSAGNTNRDVRRFLRESGVKPTIANVERIAREVRRSESENASVERIALETGRGGLRDQRGPVHPRVKKAVKRELNARGSRPR